MQLLTIEDKRDNLEKATRRELFLFAQANKVAEISDEMPAMLMRDILRRRGMTRIRIPPRHLGAMNGGRHSPQIAVPEANGIEADAISDLARQWQAQQRNSAPPPPPAVREPAEIDEKTDINVLRRMCQKRDIKMSRRDRRPDLIAKIRAHDGQDAA